MFPLTIERRLPKRYAQEGVEDPIVHEKLFTPDSSWTWLVLELDREEQMIFCFAHNASDPWGAELGYTWLGELERIRGPLGLRIERDLHWTPRPLSVAKKELGL
jgi:hypothetical protein